MAMKKEEMEGHYHSYQNSMDQVRGLTAQGLFAEALKQAFEAWDHVDGMMQYARKYHKQEFEDIEAINFVLEHAPLLFDFKSLDKLEQILKSCKRIEKNTQVCIADLLSEARSLMEQAHKLWTHLEHNHYAPPGQLSKELGGKQKQWDSIVTSWEKMRLVSRDGQEKNGRLNLQTRMGALIYGKCPQCGSIQMAPKGVLLEPTTCPDCNEKVSFVMLPLTHQSKGN